jgi:hypothetical protein
VMSPSKIPIPTSTPISSRAIPPPSSRSISRQPKIVPAEYRPIGPPASIQLHGQSYHQLQIPSSSLERRKAASARRAKGT